MEDAATAEIARAQLWQWRTFSKSTREGTAITAEGLKTQIAEIGTSIASEVPAESEMHRLIGQATALLNDLVLSEDFAEFLTLGAYETITADLKKPMALTEFDD